LHQRIGRPSRSLMMAYVFPAAAVFFLVAWTMLFRSQRISMLLRSAECTRAPELHELHVGALAAREFHKSCLEKSKPEYKLIQYCEGYEEELKTTEHKRSWEYLFYAEHNYGCSGFCNENQEPSMWTYQGYQDTCAVAVSNTMESKVASLCHQMIFVDVMIVICFMCWNEIMSATLRAVEKGEYHPMDEATFARTARTDKSYGAAAMQHQQPPPMMLAGPPMGQPRPMMGPPSARSLGPPMAHPGFFQGAPTMMPPPGTLPPGSFQPAPYVR